VTPFDTWYTAKVAPTLPNDAPKIVLETAREMMASCWNAALDAGAEAIKDTRWEVIEKVRAVRVTP
jgi:hypothetical protein